MHAEQYGGVEVVPTPVFVCLHAYPLTVLADNREQIQL